MISKNTFSYQMEEIFCFFRITGQTIANLCSLSHLVIA